MKSDNNKIQAWFNALWIRLTGVQITDGEAVRLGRLFNTLMVISIGIVITLILLFLIMIPLGLSNQLTLYVATAFPFVFIPLSVFCMIRAKHGHINSSIALYVWINFIGISVAAWLFDGVLSPAWLLYIWTVTIAGTLLSPGYSLWMTTGVVINYFAVILFYAFGLYRPLFTFGELGRDFLNVGFLIIMLVSTVGILTYLNMRSLHDSIWKLHNEVSEHKKTGKALNESREKYRTVADFTYDWEYWLGTDGSYLYVSPSCKRTTGYDSSEFLKDPDLLLSIIHPEDRVMFDQHLDDAVTSIGDVVTLNFRILTRSGEERWISHTCQPVYNSDGKWMGRRGNNRDVTERKMAEDALKYSETRLREINATKDKFFSIIAHDLRNPFNSILGFSQLLVEQIHQKDYDGIDKYTEFIRNSSQHAMDLLMNLLEWSRSQTGIMEFNPEYIEIVALINEVEKLSDYSARQKSITISKVLQQISPVLADKAMISTILRNLIFNAVKFTNPGGRIIISAEQKNNELIVSVSDNGVGIKRNDICKLFRIDETFSTTGTQNEKGTGLGLILCKEFVEKHKGKIWAESEAGKGSKFSFMIPVRIQEYQMQI